MSAYRLHTQIIKNYSSNLYMEQFLSDVSAWKSLWIFGAGPGGKKVFEWLRSNGKGRIAGFIDNSSYKQSLKLFGLAVISPEKFAHRFNPDDLVIISSEAADEMYEQLTRLHIPNENIKIIDLTFAGENNEEHEFIYGNLDGLGQIWSVLVDQKSKNVFAGLLNYKLTRDYKYLKNISDPLSWQYVDPDLIKNSSMLSLMLEHTLVTVSPD